MVARTWILVGLSLTALVAPFALSPVTAESGPWMERTVAIPGTGEVVTFEMVPGAFSVIASGTYAFGAGDSDASCTSVYGGPYKDYAPGPLLNLMVKFPWDSQFHSFWTEGDCHADHVYSRPWTCYANCPISFYVYDTYYGDNSGSITVFVDRLPN